MSGPVSISSQLDEHAAAIRAIGKRVAGDIIEIGRHLSGAKAIAGHGNWLPSLEKEFGWTDQTARKWMDIYEMAKSKPGLDFDETGLPLNSLHMLARKSTPASARDEIFDRLERGEKLTPAEIAKYVKPVPGPAAPPVEASMTVERPESRPVAKEITTSRARPPVELPPEVLIKSSMLRIHLHGIEGLFSDLDEAAEYLIAMKSSQGVDRAAFLKIGKALSEIGHRTAMPARAKAATLADKYFTQEQNVLKLTKKREAGRPQ